MNSHLTIGLVGNPNCGKTTLFNTLTGSQQRVGNWPGVTVEKKSGYFHLNGKTVEVVDLPGVYSLTMSSEGDSSLDERIACDYILQQKADVIVNIIDASNLERHLYLTTQLLEMGVPIILALNMMDIAKDQNLHIDIKKLSQHLGCPIIPLAANQCLGICELKEAICCYKRSANRHTQTYDAVFSKECKSIVANLTQCLEEHRADIRTSLPLNWLALHLLENDVFAEKFVSESVLAHIPGYQAEIQKNTGEEVDIFIAEIRYQFIEHILQTTVTFPAQTKSSWTTRIDSIVLHRIFGIPIFLAFMYLLFFFSINIGGAFQDFFDMSSQTICVDALSHWLVSLHAPPWIVVILADGVGKGINTTITFIPVIGALFLFLAFLEDSGYMARAAFVIDRFMQMLGLPGKAFVPMIVGFGCNVPAVMSARTLENKRDRILTIMMSPFMSCGARLAIYAVFITAFFPSGGQNIIFALYLIGIGMAILTGFILRSTLLKGDSAPLVMELPPYHRPHLKTLFIHAWQRLKNFVFRAGKLIVPICVLIGALNSLNIDGTMNVGEGDTHSLLSWIGQWMTPIFSPMGIHSNNWPATVGLVTGVLAKEVVVGTLNSLYSQLGHFAHLNSNEPFNIWAGLAQAFQSIPDNLFELTHAFSNPVLAQAPIDTLNQGVYGMMYQLFDGKVGAFAYLLFVLLYFPCISTMGAMLKELHRGWSLFSAFWMTGVAYGTAVVFYQAATIHRHPFSSTLWILGISLCFFSTLLAMRTYANHSLVLKEAV